MVLEWKIRRIRIGDDTLKALDGKVQGLMSVQNTTGSLYYPMETEGEVDLTIAKNTQETSLVPLIRLVQDASESVEAFKDRILLFCTMWVHRLCVAVTPEVPTSRHPASGYTVLMSELVPLGDANKVAVYVQVICHTRPI